MPIKTFFPILIFFCSCTSTNQKAALDSTQESYSIIDLTEIEYSDEPQKLSEFIDSISYIRLEEEPLISDIWNTAVVVDDEGIYIDSEQIYKYTLDGKYISSLFQNGNGPEEAIKRSRGIYDLKNKSVTFSNNVGLYYNMYSFDGKFIGYRNRSNDENPEDKFDVEKSKGNKQICAYLNNTEVYCYDYNPFVVERQEKVNPNGPYLWYAKDLRTDSIIYKSRNFHFDVKAAKQGSTAVPNGYPLDYGIIDTFFWVRPVFVDTIYRTSDFKSVRPWYVFKQKPAAADYEFKVHTMLLDINMGDLNKESLINVFSLENGVLFTYSKEKIGIGYCKANGKAQIYSAKGFTNDLDGYLKELRIKGLGGKTLFQRAGYLYMLVNAADFLEEGSKSPFPDLTEDSNPVIVKLKLKKND